MKKYLLLLLCFALLRCEDNELNKELNADILQAKNWFEKSQSLLSRTTSQNSSARLNTNITKAPDWNKSKVHQLKSGMKVVEVILNYDNYLLFSEGNSETHSSNPNVINSMLLFEFDQGEYEVYLLKTYPDNKQTQLSAQDFDQLNFGVTPNGFSGSMLVFDWNENFIGGWKIINGKKEKFYGKVKSSPNGRIRGASSASAVNCYYVDTYWYSQACVRGGGCAEPVLIEITTALVCELVIAPPSGEDGDIGGGSTEDGDCFEAHLFIEGLMVPCQEEEETEADIWEDNICLLESFVSNPCVNGVWVKLKNQDAAFQLLKNFNNENPTAQVCMAVVPALNNSNGIPLNGSTNGQTNPILIKINASLAAQRSELEVARTIFHELIHAEMWRKIQTVGGTENLDPSNFPGLFDYYSRYLKEDGTFDPIKGTPQHNLMANHYLKMITDALMGFDGVDKGDVQLRQAYEAVAWEGLKVTEIFVLKPDAEKQAIKTLMDLLVNPRAKCI